MKTRVVVWAMGTAVACACALGGAGCSSDADNVDGSSSGSGHVGVDGGGADAAVDHPAASTDVPLTPPDGPSSTADAAESDAIGDAQASADAVACVAHLDPAPDHETPGVYTSANGPTIDISSADMTLGHESAQMFAGTVMGANGDGTFYVVKVNDASGGVPECLSELSGTIPTNADTGNYGVTIPLYCGTQIVKFVWKNASGPLVVVTRVITNDCVEADIRLTISWDDLGLDWELHLIEPGGRINDNATDCTWTSCIGQSPDWGVVGDPTDNPSKDVDNTGHYGPENITLSKPVNGVYSVLVEHWGAGQPSSGQCIINVRGHVTIVPISNFIAQHVRTVATIDWPSQAVTVINSDYDCTGDWSGGCRDKLPP